MTAEEFRKEHGDYTTWTNTDFTVYQDLVQADAPDFTLHMNLGTGPFPIPTAPTAA